MVKSKSACMAKLPKEQRCQFLIGPLSSWFMPRTSDIWTQPAAPKTAPEPSQDENSQKQNHQKETTGGDVHMSVLEDNLVQNEARASDLSYFIYGSIGCFCYGEIHHHKDHKAASKSLNSIQHQYQPQNSLPLSSPISAVANRLLDIKEDNSRVSCVRFLKNSLFPIAMVLTENGSFLIHDCLTSETLIHFKKSELINKFIGPPPKEDLSDEPRSKKPKFNVTQQISGFCWPTARNAFMGISLPKDKSNLLVWLKLKDLTEVIGDKSVDHASVNKDEVIESFEKLNLDLNQFPNPICCMESTLIEPDVCLIAVATDDGLITIARVNFTQGQAKRVIKLARHSDQLCSMSFYSDNVKGLPSVLLATASRDGLVLIWDVENEYYFADYQASSPEISKTGSKINWFALCFIELQRHPSLAVSNCINGLTVLDLPEKIPKTKIRLKDDKEVRQQKPKLGGYYGTTNTQTLHHHALIFNISFDRSSKTVMTSSLDASHILWTIAQQQDMQSKSPKKDGMNLEVKPVYLIPSMPNHARTHMLRHSPIREDLLGIALGKAGLRFFKIAANQRRNRFDMSTSCSFIARKINKAPLSPTSIAWHPNHEYRIAIGTLEGKVLRADITPKKGLLLEAEPRRVVPSTVAHESEKDDKKIDEEDKIFDVEYTPLERTTVTMEGDSTREDVESIKEEFHKTDGIYSLCWGPNPQDPGNTACLAMYGIGSISHRLFIYYSWEKNLGDKLINCLEEFTDVSIPEMMGEASEVTWKPSMDFMALGTTTGKVIIASLMSRCHNHVSMKERHFFMRLAVIQGPFGNSNIQCLVWHPTMNEDDFHYYSIAASSCDSAAFIFNMKESILASDFERKLKLQRVLGYREEYIEESRCPSIISTFSHKLDAHKKTISDIAWSPHQRNVLATCSFDRICYTWSLAENSEDRQTTAAITSRFLARDRLFTLDWSLVDADLIFTSGHDSTIWAWRPSENPIKNEL